MEYFSEDVCHLLPFNLNIICFHYPCKTQQRHESFFLSYNICLWNWLSQYIVLSGSVETVETAVSSKKYKFLKLVNSFNLFQSSCATPKIILNLPWSVFDRSRRSRSLKDHEKGSCFPLTLVNGMLAFYYNKL